MKKVGGSILVLGSQVNLKGGKFWAEIFEHSEEVRHANIWKKLPGKEFFLNSGYWLTDWLVYIIFVSVIEVPYGWRLSWHCNIKMRSWEHLVHGGHSQAISNKSFDKNKKPIFQILIEYSPYKYH